MARQANATRSPSSPAYSGRAVYRQALRGVLRSATVTVNQAVSPRSRCRVLRFSSTSTPGRTAASGKYATG